MISARTKAALAAAKARGVKLGGATRNHRNVDGALGSAALRQASDDFAASVRPVVAELRQGGMSLRQAAAELTRRGIRTMRGGTWTQMTVRGVLLRGIMPPRVRVRPRKLPQPPAAAQNVAPPMPEIPWNWYRPPGRG
jgi:hypothetical protein